MVHLRNTDTGALYGYSQTPWGMKISAQVKNHWLWQKKPKEWGWKGSQWYYEHKPREVSLFLASRPGTSKEGSLVNTYQESTDYNVRDILPPATD